MTLDDEGRSALQGIKLITDKNTTLIQKSRGEGKNDAVRAGRGKAKKKNGPPPAAGHWQPAMAGWRGPGWVTYRPTGMFCTHTPVFKTMNQQCFRD